MGENTLVYCKKKKKATVLQIRSLTCLILVCFLMYHKISKGGYHKESNIPIILNQHL